MFFFSVKASWMDESWEISGFFGVFFPREGGRWIGLKWGVAQQRSPSNHFFGGMTCSFNQDPLRIHGNGIFIFTSIPNGWYGRLLMQQKIWLNFKLTSLFGKTCWHYFFVRIRFVRWTHHRSLHGKARKHRFWTVSVLRTWCRNATQSCQLSTAAG